MTDLARFEALVPLDDGLSVVVTRRPDGTPHATVVNAGVLAHPVTGHRVVAFVSTADSRKVVHVRADPVVSLVVRAGWEWAAVDGRAELIGPDDAGPVVEEFMRLGGEAIRRTLDR